jgi:hypothetical protein
MRKPIVPYGTLFVAILSSAMPISAQHHVVVIATGNLHGSSFVNPAGRGTNNWESLSVKQVIDPGVELVFKPESRFSFSLGYARVRFEPSTFGGSVVQDSFQYKNAQNQIVTVEMPGTVFASVTTTENATMNAALGMAYLNFAGEHKVRPFIGVGGGLGLVDDKFRTETYVHPLFAELAGFKFDIPPTHSVRNQVGIAAAKAGVNIHPVSHFVVRICGGYLNGGYGELGLT